MITARCHCGAVRLEVRTLPPTLTDCNCSLCGRYGALWAYYPGQQVRIQADENALRGYRFGEGRLVFHACRHCQCVTHHTHAASPRENEVGVNARQFPRQAWQDLRIRHLDGACTLRYLD